MDTIYYNLTAKKVKVSGGADWVTFVPQVVSAPGEQPRGEVLDFAFWRQKLQTKNAWKELNHASQEVTAAMSDEIDPVSVPAPRTRRSHAMDWLETVASAAVILVALCAAWSFLHVI